MLSSIEFAGKNNIRNLQPRKLRRIFLTQVSLKSVTNGLSRKMGFINRNAAVGSII